MSKSKEERNSMKRSGGMVSNVELLEDKVQGVENEAQELCERETVWGCINCIKEYGSALSSRASDGKD